MNGRCLTASLFTLLRGPLWWLPGKTRKGRSEQHICVYHVLPHSHVTITITDKHQINASKSNADPNRCSK